ncbi:hypothetical protein [Tissierella sp. Yu-01]|uniref:hypothetical protein n=1 Tax=Tissierella sp. Yu-01 TaxID=3035694 RepID=UPI00240D7AA3|nr:hypothetical protein [Tissierella sp. Yu-01]WFA09533.1 hypothetical protein P3962_02985 [Tissierella sp. Yu-01]
MESRVERHQRKRKRFFSRLVKSIILIVLIIFFTFYMVEVNDTIKDLNVLENTELLDIDLSKGSISILGKTYNITVK